MKSHFSILEWNFVKLGIAVLIKEIIRAGAKAEIIDQYLWPSSREIRNFSFLFVITIKKNPSKIARKLIEKLKALRV